MPKLDECIQTHKPRRIVRAPPSSYPGLYSGVLNVDCAEDEEVEWYWTETAAGRFVSGYRIVPRMPKPLG